MTGFQRSRAYKRPHQRQRGHGYGQQPAAARRFHAPEQQRKDKVQQENDAQKPLPYFIKGGCDGRQVTVQAEQRKNHAPARDVSVVAVEHFSVQKQRSPTKPVHRIHSCHASRQIGPPRKPPPPLPAERGPGQQKKQHQRQFHRIRHGAANEPAGHGMACPCALNIKMVAHHRQHGCQPNDVQPRQIVGTVPHVLSKTPRLRHNRNAENTFFPL